MTITHHRALAAGICLGLALAAAPAGAISLGTVNTFEAGSTNGWHVADGSPLPPQAMPGGGPAGSGDGYLQLSSTGQSGAGSRLVVFGSNDWLGNYITAGVTAIGLDAINQGAGDLQLRLYFNGPGGSALSSAALTLTAGSGWTHLVFPTVPTALAGANAAATLADVREFRLFHNEAASFPPAAVLGTLGIDNVTAVSAVPEPGTLLLWAAGAVVLPLARRRARRAGADGTAATLQSI